MTPSFRKGQKVVCYAHDAFGKISAIARYSITVDEQKYKTEVPKSALKWNPFLKIWHDGGQRLAHCREID